MSLEEGWRHYRAGRLTEAQKVARAVLERDPSDAGALHLLGSVLISLRQTEFAVLPLEQATRLQPDDASYARTLAFAYAQGGALDAALQEYDRVLAGDPDSALTLAQKGALLTDHGREEEGLAALERAVELRPDSGDCQIRLADALLAAGRADEARAAYQRALADDPEYDNWHLRSGENLYVSGRPEDARQMYERGLALGSANPELPHLVAALSGERPVRPDDRYVASLFDRMAEHFDETLVGRLRYRVPEALLELLEPLLPADRRGELDILDAGCGTGLAAPLLRPLSRRLVGLDLSPRMIDRARGRGLYDETVVGEITAALRAQPATWDVIYSADTVIYFGALEDLMSAAAAALRPGGLFAFSVERSEGADYRLGPSGRYAHSQPYLRRAAEAAGLREARLVETQLRQEGEHGVVGHMVVLSRA